jgi:hypothetical protein
MIPTPSLRVGLALLNPLKALRLAPFLAVLLGLFILNAIALGLSAVRTGINLLENLMHGVWGRTPNALVTLILLYAGIAMAIYNLLALEERFRTTDLVTISLYPPLIYKVIRLVSVSAGASVFVLIVCLLHLSPATAYERAAYGVAYATWFLGLAVTGVIAYALFGWRLKPLAIGLILIFQYFLPLAVQPEVPAEIIHRMGGSPTLQIIYYLFFTHPYQASYPGQQAFFGRLLLSRTLILTLLAASAAIALLAARSALLSPGRGRNARIVLTLCVLAVGGAGGSLIGFYQVNKPFLAFWEFNRAIIELEEEQPEEEVVPFVGARQGSFAPMELEPSRDLTPLLTQFSITVVSRHIRINATNGLARIVTDLEFASPLPALAFFSFPPGAKGVRCSEPIHQRPVECRALRDILEVRSGESALKSLRLEYKIPRLAMTPGGRVLWNLGDPRLPFLLTQSIDLLERFIVVMTYPEEFPSGFVHAPNFAAGLTPDRLPILLGIDPQEAARAFAKHLREQATKNGVCGETVRLTVEVHPPIQQPLAGIYWLCDPHTNHWAAGVAHGSQGTLSFTTSAPRTPVGPTTAVFSSAPYLLSLSSAPLLRVSVIGYQDLPEGARRGLEKLVTRLNAIIQEKDLRAPAGEVWIRTGALEAYFFSRRDWPTHLFPYWCKKASDRIGDSKDRLRVFRPHYQMYLCFKALVDSAILPEDQAETGVLKWLPPDERTRFNALRSHRGSPAQE